MLGMEFVQDRESRLPAPAIVESIITRAREKGVLMLKAGIDGNVLRILVPLIIDDALLSHALDTINAVVHEVTHA